MPKSSKPTRNESGVIAALLNTPAWLTIHEIAAATDLNTRQVHYALGRPVQEGLVVVAGGQGHKDTRYCLHATMAEDSVEGS